MFHVFLLLISCTVLAYAYESGTTEVAVTEGNKTLQKKESTFLSSTAFIVLTITMILYAGLRSAVNDTANYARGFEKIAPSISGLDWSLGNNPLFIVYEVVLKKFVTNSASVFFLITSFLVVLSYLLFIKKYSVNFGLSIYLFISFTLYAFTMAALKQTIAIAIAIWAIPLILEKKYVRALLLIAIATLFHAFTFVFLIAFVMGKSIWDKRAVIIIIATIIIGVSFSMFVGQALDFTNSIGGNAYEFEDFVSGTGTSFLRIIVYLIPSILTFAFRDKLRESKDPFLSISINLSLVASCLMALAGIGGANLTGRLAGYFDLFICFSLPSTLKYGIESKKTRNLAIVVVFIAFAFFYYSYYRKFAVLYPNPFTDYYEHSSLFTVLAGW